METFSALLAFSAGNAPVDIALMICRSHSQFSFAQDLIFAQGEKIQCQLKNAQKSMWRLTHLICALKAEGT